jgi:hypothetical protein
MIEDNHEQFQGQVMPALPSKQGRNAKQNREHGRNEQQVLAQDQRPPQVICSPCIVSLVDRYRAQLAPLLVFDGDVRRATVVAVKPLVAGATTTTDVLERVLTEEDLQRLDKLAQEVSRKSGSQAG